MTRTVDGLPPGEFNLPPGCTTRDIEAAQQFGGEYDCPQGCGEYEAAAEYPTCPVCKLWLEVPPHPDHAIGGPGVRACLDAAVEYWVRYEQPHHAAMHACNAVRICTDPHFRGGLTEAGREAWEEWFTEQYEQTWIVMEALAWRPPVLTEQGEDR